MSNRPDRPEGVQQETPADETPPKPGAPQASQAQSPQDKQEFYWRRQAEKLEKELASLRTEREVELTRLARDRDEATARAAEAEWAAKRLSLITEARLPSELIDLVPEGDPEIVGAYLEKLKPIAEKLGRPLPRGLTNTNPPNSAGTEEARLQRLASQAARGDRRALREYSHLRERAKQNS